MIKVTRHHGILNGLDLQVTTYIPSRSEGHGVNRSALKALHDDGCTLVITADCGVGGINDGAAVPRGMDIIVTDHHMPGDDLPDFAADDASAAGQYLHQIHPPDPIGSNSQHHRKIASERLDRW